MASFYTRPQNPDSKLGCGKCGYVGHLTFQCRNFQQANPNKPAVVDISPTSSTSSDDEYATPLQQIAQEQIRREKEKKESESTSKKPKKTERKRHRSRSSSRSSESDSNNSKRKHRRHSSKSKKPKHRRHSSESKKTKHRRRHS